MNRMINLFYESLRDMVKEMADIEVKQGEETKNNGQVRSLGLTSIINFAGKVKGRLLLDMEIPVVLQFASNLYGQEFSNPRDPLVMTSISELNNIVAGDAITKLNNLHQVGLRLAPPIVLVGTDVIISIPRITTQSLDCVTQFGRVRLNIAFEGGVF